MKGQSIWPRQETISSFPFGSQKFPRTQPAAAAANPAAAKTAKPEGLIKIENARWGGGRNWADVTGRVQEVVDQHESVWASPDFLKKDPTPGWRKHLEIRFSKEGRQRTITLDEGQHWSKADYEGDKKEQKVVADNQHPAPPATVATNKNPPTAAAPPTQGAETVPQSAGAKPNQAAGQPTEPSATPGQSDQTEVSLPGNVANVAVGGGGRFLILHLAQLRKLAVFDMNAAKIVKYIPLPEDEVCIAAGIDKLIVGLPQANAFQRWNLQTFEREVTVPNPLDGAISDLVMGSASTGPLLVNFAGRNALLNPRTFRQLSIRAPERGLPGRAQGLISHRPMARCLSCAKAGAAKGIRWGKS